MTLLYRQRPVRDLIGPSIQGRVQHDPERVPLNVRPAVRKRLRDLLFEPELRGVGYSEFIERACEAAETQIAVERTS